MSLNPNFYTQTIGGQKADFYRICLAYGITDPCIAHALKKLLRAGRSHKSLMQDVQDTIDTLKRWQQIREEDCTTGMVMEAIRDQEPMQLKTVEVKIDFIFLPVNPIWSEEYQPDDWVGPGWYISYESDPFSMFTTQLEGPYETLARAKTLYENPDLCQ